MDLSVDTSTLDGVYEEFASSTLGKLKDYLAARGLSCVGNKQQLVSRCFVAFESKAPLKFSEKQQEEKLKIEYSSRLKELNITDPQSFSDDSWTSDVKGWPKVDLGKIFSFLISKKEQDMDFIGNYKSQKAYSYFMSGFVDIVYSIKENGRHVIKSCVTPSQSIRNEPHDLWMAIDEDHNILGSWCRCIAGHAQICNHVIAVLYKLEYVNNLGYNNPSCTSIPCGWNSSTRKDVQPCCVSAMNPRKDDRRKMSGMTINLKS